MSHTYPQRHPVTTASTARYPQQRSTHSYQAASQPRGSPTSNGSSNTRYTINIQQPSPPNQPSQNTAPQPQRQAHYPNAAEYEEEEPQQYQEEHYDNEYKQHYDPNNPHQQEHYDDAELYLDEQQTEEQQQPPQDEYYEQQYYEQAEGQYPAADYIEYPADNNDNGMEEMASSSQPLHTLQESEHEHDEEGYTEEQQQQLYDEEPEEQANRQAASGTLGEVMAANRQNEPPLSSPTSSDGTYTQHTDIPPYDNNAQTAAAYLEALSAISTQLQRTDSDAAKEALTIIERLRYGCSAVYPYADTQQSSIMRFISHALPSYQLTALLTHCAQQIHEHLTLALSVIGYYSHVSSACALRLSSSVLHARLYACRAALTSIAVVQPQIYLSAYYAQDVQRMSFELGVPVSAFHILPSLVTSTSSSALSHIHSINVAELQRLLQKHKKEKKTPALLLLALGSTAASFAASSVFHYDDVGQVFELAKSFGLWIHGEGSQVIECAGEMDEGEEVRQEMHNGDLSQSWQQHITAYHAEHPTSFPCYLAQHLHSLVFDASQYFQQPDSACVACTLFTETSPIDAEVVLPSRLSSLASLSSVALLTLWSQLCSLSFSAVLAFFPRAHTRTQEKVIHLRDALSSFTVTIHQAPDEQQSNTQIPLPPLLFFSLSLSPPFSAAFFHLTASQVNALLAENLYRRCAHDTELTEILTKQMITPITLTTQHHRPQQQQQQQLPQTGFLYQASFRQPETDDSVQHEKVLLTHLAAVLIDELSVISSCGNMKSTVETQLHEDADFQWIAAQDLQPDVRPGLVAFRFTPASIPASFHDDLTVALSQSLINAAPAVYRSGVTSSGQGVIIVELNAIVLELTVSNLLHDLRKMSKRVPLPPNVEQHLSAELKKSISEAETKMKAGRGGVIRAIPIVGSFFSYFAGKPQTKSHSYDINTSYPPADKKKTESPHRQPVPAPTTSAVNTEPVTALSSNDGVVHRGSSAKYASGAAPQDAQVYEQQQEQDNPVPQHTEFDEEQLYDAGDQDQTYDEQQAYQDEEPYDPNNQPYDDETRQDQQQQQYTTDQHQYTDEVDDQHLHSEQHLHPEQDDQQMYADQIQPEQYIDEKQLHPDTDLVPSDQQLFSQLERRDPELLLQYITEGQVFTVYFPTTSDPNDPSAQAIPLYLFYDADQAALCWCEPGNRYISREQTLPIHTITELHLGSAPIYFPADIQQDNCFSIVSDLITLHCEAENLETSNEFLLSLYWLLSQVNQPNTTGDQGQKTDAQPQAQQQVPVYEPQQPPPPAASTQSRQALKSRGEEKTTSSSGAAVSATPSASPPVSKSSVHSHSQVREQSQRQRDGRQVVSTNNSSSVVPVSDPSLEAALQLLEQGHEFTVFLVDRHQPDVTTRHSVILWWIPDTNLGKGRLCWSRVPTHIKQPSSPVKLEYHPQRSLVLSKSVEVNLGKQSKAFCNPGMEDVDPNCCMSIMVDNTVLNLTAADQAHRDRWLHALHVVLVTGGKKRVTTVSA